MCSMRFPHFGWNGTLVNSITAKSLIALFNCQFSAKPCVISFTMNTHTDLWGPLFVYTPTLLVFCHKLYLLCFCIRNSWFYLLSSPNCYSTSGPLSSSKQKAKTILIWLISSPHLFFFFQGPYSCATCCSRWINSVSSYILFSVIVVFSSKTDLVSIPFWPILEVNIMYFHIILLYYFIKLSFFKFNWDINDIQFCVSLRCTA